MVILSKYLVGDSYLYTFLRFNNSNFEIFNHNYERYGLYIHRLREMAGLQYLDVLLTLLFARMFCEFLFYYVIIRA